jgi:hypothetical protein
MTEVITVLLKCECGAQTKYDLSGGELELRCHACGSWHKVEKAREYRKELTPDIPGN